MAGTIIPEGRIRRTLDAEAADRAMLQACRQRATLHLRAGEATIEATCVGIAFGSEGSQLTLKVQAIDPRIADDLATATVQADMGLADAQYTFETRFVGPISLDGEGLVHIAEPASVTVIERRRSRRRWLRKTTEVTLLPVEPGDPWQCRAVLLNLSEDGMACRIRQDQTSHTPIGQTLLVRFHLEPDTEDFELSGRVISVTQAGSSYQAVLGTEFIDDERLASARDALRGALRDAS